MPLNTFVSCCGLGANLQPQPQPSRARQSKHASSRRTSASGSNDNNNNYYTVMSPPTAATPKQMTTGVPVPANGSAVSSASSAASSTPRQLPIQTQQQKFIALRMLLQVDPHQQQQHQQQQQQSAVCDDFVLRYPNYSYSSSIGSSSLLLASSSADTSASLEQRCHLRPVAASSPSTTPQRQKAKKQLSSAAKKQQRPASTSSSTSSSNGDSTLLLQQLHNNSCLAINTLMMHVYEASPYKGQQQQPQPQEEEDDDSNRTKTIAMHQQLDERYCYGGDDEDNVELQKQQLKSARKPRLGMAVRFAQSTIDLKQQAKMAPPSTLDQQVVGAQQVAAATTKPPKKQYSFMSWSKKLVQAFTSSSSSSSSSSSNEQNKTPKASQHQTAPPRHFETASKASALKFLQQNSNKQQKAGGSLSRQAVSVVNCHLKNEALQNSSSSNKLTAFQPISPESHIEQQSPYRKQPDGARSFFKSKSTAAFRDLGKIQQQQQQQQASNMNYFMLSSAFSSPSASSSACSSVQSPPRGFDQNAVAYLLQDGHVVSPSQPALIMRDWSSCALAAASATQRRRHPLPMETIVTPQSANLISLLRAYNVPNSLQVGQRLLQLANIGSVEQLAQLAMQQPEHARRVIRKVAQSDLEAQRLADLVFDLVNLAGGQLPPTQQKMVLNNNSSTDSGVYGSDEEPPVIAASVSKQEQVLVKIRDYLQRAQIDLSSLPYSDKFGFGHIQAEWSLALAEVFRVDEASDVAVALDKLRLEALRLNGRIGIPQKELVEQVKLGQQQQRNRLAAITSGMRSLGRAGHVVSATISNNNNGSASLNRRAFQSSSHLRSSNMMECVRL